MTGSKKVEPVLKIRDSDLIEAEPAKYTVLILGGYGNFGKRLSDLLLQHENISLVIAGPNESKAKQLQVVLQQKHPEHAISALVLDRNADDFVEKLKNARVDILVHTAGPFQNQSYQVAHACLEAKVHYVDIADARDYVINIEALQEQAVEKNIVMVSGASSVPGLSSAVIAHYASLFSNVLEIDFGISPGNQVERGLGTLRSVFDYVGKPFQQLNEGKWQKVYGWQQMHRVYFGDNVGMRWMSCCDVPDLALLPKKYPHVRSVRFFAGLELGFLHLMMWVFSWVVRSKLLRNLAPLSKLILKISKWFDKWGSPTGGMYLHMYGTDKSIQPYDITWHLIAESAHGLNIPIIPAYLVINKIIRHELTPGARPCDNLFTLEAFDKVASQWHIYHTVQEVQM